MDENTLNIKKKQLESLQFFHFLCLKNTRGSPILCKINLNKV